MPKGFHYGRAQTRHYTNEYHRISAKTFKELLNCPVGEYTFNQPGLNQEHAQFRLIKNNCWPRVMIYTIKDKEVPVPLATDNRSASNKTYLICPYCAKQRQHLYAVKNAYACRECLDLHYASQSEREQDRLARRIRKQRANLWGYDHPERVNLMESSYWWPKPKWMRWKTFEQKRKEIKALEDRYWQLSSTQLIRWFGSDFEHLLTG